MALFLQILKYFPYVLQGIMAVESALKGAPGATKKAVVMAAIEAGAHVGQTVVEQPVVQGISNLIDTTVTALNASGLLGKSVPPTP
jgi:hypothetical protein